MTCPHQTESCKITEHAKEPDYEEILVKVFCFSKNEKVLLEVENVIGNPNKGQSLDSTRTFDKHDEVYDNIEDEFDTALKNFDFKLFDNFGKRNGFFEDQ